MSGDEEQRPESARRVKAAIAYSGKSQAAVAEAMKRAGATKGSLRSLGRWGNQGIANDDDPRVISWLAEACGLPDAFFTADFALLYTLPPRPAERTDAAERVSASAAAAAQQRRDSRG